MAEEQTGRKVIIPVDGSEHSVRAFNWYCQNLHGNDDLIIITHVHELPVVPATSYPYGNPYYQEWQKLVKQSKQEARELVEGFGQLCQQNKFKFKLFLEADIGPGEAICKLAKDESANFVVLGSRGQNALRRTLLGSISDYVVHHAHIPVAVVPPPKPLHK